MGVLAGPAPLRAVAQQEQALELTEENVEVVLDEVPYPWQHASWKSAHCHSARPIPPVVRVAGGFDAICLSATGRSMGVFHASASHRLSAA